ncbi:MAG TPA: EscU/YscU/HrcU family type III secretion system export apparatus switch protein [Chloroflexota bacterium]|nr:EscU/YscU/HrcU family type III secretion system export apparatus switch protein [Chloroflexota bacterium]
MSGERTEAATPRRLEQLRGEGRAPRSPELGSSIGLLVGLIILQNTAASAGMHLQALLTGALSDFGTTGRAQDIDLLWAQQAFGKAGQAWFLSVAPLLIVLPVLGIGVGLAQGDIFSFKSMLHFDTLNPMSGVKRLFSLQALVGLGRSLAKVTLVGGLTWRALLDTAARLPSIDGSTDPRAMGAFIGQAVLDVGIPAAEVLLALAFADYAYQRWNFARSARMSLQEVKEEHKQQDGDPMLKGQIRARQRAMAKRGRQIEDVPQATVVVTNPTHIAVALQYQPGMPSPKVLAVGADLIAEKIKQVARAAGVPCVENVPLARGLFKAVQVGDEIPVELYQAVAEVLAYVYSLKRKRRRAA